MRADKPSAVAESVGETLFRFGDAGYHLWVPETQWQGFYRTVQAEAQAKLLKERGWTVTMYYQMD